MQQSGLVEPALRVHIAAMLENCRSYKDSIINFAVNISLLVVIIFIGWGILTYKANNRIEKLSDHEQESAKRDFVLQAIGQGRPPPRQGPITGLSGFTSDVRFRNE
jgi:hypothetical protein